MGGLRRHKYVVCFVQMHVPKPEGIEETIAINSSMGKEWQFLYASTVWEKKLTKSI